MYTTATLNREGELPEGVYHATMDEVLTQFGDSTPQRQAVTARLRHIYQLASATGKLTPLVISGSYVTTKPHPNDVDVRCCCTHRQGKKQCKKN